MTASQKGPHHAAPFALGWLLGYIAFVIYGSLVPLEFQAVPLAAAWLKFQHMPMLELGVDSRADWVANGVLFFPIGFLAVDRLLGRNGGSNASLGRLVAALLGAVILSGLLAAGIEFTQIFFPARTVSLNDVLAECLGGLLGAAVALRYADWLRALASAFDRKPAQIVGLALQSYLAAYLAYSLFPYDFLISAAELDAKLHSTQWSWWIAPDEFANGRLRLAARLLVETLAAAPFGIWLARRNRQTPSLAATLGFGAALGIAIELAQFLTATGISQGLSLATRAIGCGLGAMLWQMRHRYSELRAAALLRRATLPLAPVYLLALAALNGWFNHSWQGLEAALDALDSVRFMPFYYHYYTTESAALISLVAVVGQYAPIGMATWAWRQVPMMAGVLAMLLATMVESSRLFIVGTHADPTNILIAGVAGWLAGAIVPRFMQALEAEARAPRNPPPSAASAASDTSDTAAVDAQASTAHAAQAAVASAQKPAREMPPSGRVSIVAMLCTAALIAYAPSHPLGMLWPIGAALAYLALLRRWPHAWLIAVPAMLPILDLAPWTGRFFFDEFDALMLATVAVAGWRRPAKPLSWRAPGAAQLAFALFALSAIAALLIGAWPYPLPDANAFNNYHSPYNALRIAKGLLWALLLLPLLNRELHRDPQRAHRLFATGMSMGALAAGASALWERLAYTGLFDFGQDYRVVGMFSGTHTGGAYLEAFLVAALPFAAWQLATTRHWTARLLGLAALVVGSYAVMVTYARAGHIALAIAFLVLAAGLLRGRVAGSPLSRIGAAATLVLMLAGIAWPILNGSFMQERIAKSSNDFHVRTAHWADAQRMMADDGPLTLLFGKGLGRYQETYFWKSAEGIHPGSYRLGADGGAPHLALGAGSPLYVEQIVTLRSAQHYRLTLAARGSADKAELGISLCEKWMLYSRNCIWHALPVGNTGGQWRTSTLDLDTAQLPEHPWYERPIVKLSFLNQTGDAAIDIRQISLQTAEGNQILRNGDFAAGLDRWFFSIDQDLPWHIENLWMQVYFEQGAVGLLLFLLLLVQLALVLTKRLRDPGLPIAALAAALAGYLTVGVVDSLFDSPRMALLFYLLLAFSVLHSRSGRHR